MTNYTNSSLLLTLVAALSPRVLPYSELIEQFYARPEEQLRTFVAALNLACKRRMDDLIIPHDILTNNTSHIIQLLAYLYVTRHGLGTGPTKNPEDPYQTAVVGQAYAALFPFVKACVALDSLPVTLLKKAKIGC